MKIAIISDTHDNTPAVVWIIEYLNQHGIKLALHAGDLINPGILYRFQEHYLGHLHYIFGNNEGELLLAERRSATADNITCHNTMFRSEIAGRQIFMHHFSEVSELVAQSGQVDLAIGGHDHRFRVVEYGQTVFVNPDNTVTKDKWLPQEADKESSFVVFDLKTMQAERIMLPAEFQAED